MDAVRLGRQVRALRRHRAWRQDDLARAAGVSRSVVARVEQGLADRTQLRILERLAAALGARFVARLDWNGEALDRLLDGQHAATVDRMVRILRGLGWLVATEVSFNVAGERGSIDMLAWHPGRERLVVIEVKSVVPDVQQTLFALDRKVRLAVRIAGDRGWRAQTASRLLVIAEDRTSRRRIDRHAATFGNAFPERTAAVRRWLADPPEGDRPLSGLMFLTGDRQAVARHRVRRDARRARA